MGCSSSRLYSVAGGGHQLYHGKTYQLIRSLDINPADLEQVYWDTSDPDILYYVDNQEFIRYHVNAGTQDKLHSFSGLCGSSSVSNGGDPMFTSWDSHRLGLVCGNLSDWGNGTSVDSYVLELPSYSH